MKYLLNVIVVVIGIFIVVGAIWFFQEENIETVNTTDDGLINNINVQIDTNNSVANINSSNETNILINTTEIEIVDIETDISDLSVIESDLEIPELDFDVAF